jgi:hypothetical protein
MMAGNKEQRVCVKFCFLLGTIVDYSDYSAAVRFRTVPDRKQNSTHTLCSLLSAIIKIAKPRSRHLEKKPQQQ